MAREDDPIEFQIADELTAAVVEAERDVVVTTNPAAFGVERLVIAVIDAWAHHPKWRHRDMVRHLVERHGAGAPTAEEAVRSARLVLQERACDPALTDRIVAAYMLDLERADLCYQKCIAEGDRRAAILAIREHSRTLQMMSKHLGIVAPERVEVTTTISVREERVAALTDEELEIMAKLDIVESQETTAS